MLISSCLILYISIRYWIQENWKNRLPRELNAIHRKYISNNNSISLLQDTWLNGTVRESAKELLELELVEKAKILEKESQLIEELEEELSKKNGYYQIKFPSLLKWKSDNLQETAYLTAYLASNLETAYQCGITRYFEIIE